MAMAMTYCVLGDSVGKGVVFDAISSRYRVLKESFANLFSASRNAVVENLSAFGCTVTKGLQIAKRHSERMIGPGAILLEFGGNDCDFDWAAVSAEPDADHKCKTPMDDFHAKYTELIAWAREEGKTPVLMNLPPIDPDRYFAHISKGLNPDNILQFLGDVDRIYRWHEYYSLAVNKLAAEADVPLIDVRSAFLERRRCLDMICEDGIHPNAQGHAFLFEIISQEAERLLKGRSA